MDLKSHSIFRRVYSHKTGGCFWMWWGGWLGRQALAVDDVTNLFTYVPCPVPRTLGCLYVWIKTHVAVKSNPICQTSVSYTAVQVSYSQIQSEMNCSCFRGTRLFTSYFHWRQDGKRILALTLENSLFSSLQGQFTHTHSYVSIFLRRTWLSFAGAYRESTVPFRKGGWIGVICPQYLAREVPNLNFSSWVTGAVKPQRGIQQAEVLWAAASGMALAGHVPVPLACPFAAYLAVGHVSGLSVSCCCTLFIFILVPPCISTNLS